MSIDLAHFTPLTALGGGVLIGLAAALLVVFNGRIAGISSIVGGLLRPQRGEVGWRIAFFTGMMAAPLLYQAFSRLPLIQVDAEWPALVAAGLLVGIGTRYGSGCTSGHGVCGLSRLSPRSMIATLVFMGSGFLTVFVIRHLLGA